MPSEIEQTNQVHTTSFHKVRSHIGVVGNEKADNEVRSHIGVVGNEKADNEVSEPSCKVTDIPVLCVITV